MKIAVVGAGYVGLSLAVLLSQRHEVVVLDLLPEKVIRLNRRDSPIEDQDIIQYLKQASLHLRATLDKTLAYMGADFAVVCIPTNYDPYTNYFTTQSIESVICDALRLAPEATIVIKSTVPVGFTERMRRLYNTQQILFSPEFLREGLALHDNLYPSRIIVGGHGDSAHAFSSMLYEAALSPNVPVLFTGSAEAEAIKLFANTYLAMRVAFFNELDTYAAARGLNTHEIIQGVGMDPRIGLHYNNPSFGYGGYCLPKDTKQLLANYEDVPQNLIRAIIDSNTTRMDFIASEVMRRTPRTVGIYRLIMKSGSDNFRSSSIVGIIDRLISSGIHVLVYEPALMGGEYFKTLVTKDLQHFKQCADLILANRITADLQDVTDKTYSRDIFGCD